MSDQYDRQLDINLRAFPVLVRAASKYMPSGGRIIAIGSVAAARLGISGMTEYGAGKAAVAAYVRGYAWDLGPRGITVNVVQPGPVVTDMNPEDTELAVFLKSKNALKRFGRVEEIASLVYFLVGNESGFITGACLNIDGGSLA